MKKVIAAVIVTLALSACASLPETPEINTGQIFQAAKCIEVGRDCTDLATQFMHVKDWDAADVAWDRFEKCLDVMSDMGCSQLAGDLFQAIEAAKAKAESEGRYDD